MDTKKIARLTRYFVLPATLLKDTASGAAQKSKLVTQWWNFETPAAAPAMIFPSGEALRPGPSIPGAKSVVPAREMKLSTEGKRSASRLREPHYDDLLVLSFIGVAGAGVS